MTSRVILSLALLCGIGGAAQLARSTGSGGQSGLPQARAAAQPPAPPAAAPPAPPRGSALGKTYYVAPGGSDAAAGTAAAPWKTLQKAANMAVAGDTVRVAAGTYAGMNVYGRPGGTAGAPIRFLADPGVVIDRVPGSGLPNDGAAGINIERSGGHYVVQGFTVRGDGSMQKAGIRATGSDHTRLLNNTVRRAFTGIFVSGSRGVVVEGNTCADATDQHGIYVSGCQGCAIRGNTCSGNNWDGIHLNVLNGQLGATDSALLVEGNVCRDNKLSGMDIEGVSNCTFRNNLVYGNGKHGFTLHSQDQANTPPTRGNLFVNNTAAGNGMCGIQMRSADAANTLSNNILLSASRTYGGIGTEGTPAGLSSDYNVVADSLTTTLGQSRLTLAQWRAQTGQDRHSLVATPAALFVSAAGNDYRLKAGSPAIDRGTATRAPAADIAGTARPQGAGIDIGAYEFR